MTDVGHYIGHLNCDNCDSIVYIMTVNDIKIWHHPDDLALAEVKCDECGEITQSRLSLEHMVNFRLRGCKIADFNDKFEDNPITESMIDDWDDAAIVAELKELTDSVL